jgi:transcriptional regulator with XRE-family HTH domain
MAKGLTQEQMAEKADVSRRHIQRIEAGEMNPSIDKVARFRQALDCTWDDLFEGLP